MYKIITTFLITLITFLIVSCATHEFNYTKPIQKGDFTNTIVIDKPFDEVWSSFIRIIGQTSYGIDNFEKNSGLLTLSFVNGKEFIDCGYGVVKANSGYPNFINRDKEGEYTDLADAEVLGRMNIVITKRSDNKTRITINTSYIINLLDGTKHSFQFTSKNISGQTKRIGQTDITCLSTYKFEFSILEAIQQII